MLIYFGRNNYFFLNLICKKIQIIIANYFEDKWGISVFFLSELINTSTIEMSVIGFEESKALDTAYLDFDGNN